MPDWFVLFNCVKSFFDFGFERKKKRLSYDASFLNTYLFIIVIVLNLNCRIEAQTEQSVLIALTNSRTHHTLSTQTLKNTS